MNPVLSPLTVANIAAVVLARANDAVEPWARRGGVERVVMYRCPVCDELHDRESDAEKCCSRFDPEQIIGSDPICPVCGEKHEKHRDAADCCLWKDIDAYTRWAIADAVEAGSDWATELGLRQYGVTISKEAA